MTVDDVIRLSQSGISDDLLIAQIKKRPQPFDLSTDQLLQLKAAHVSDRVIGSMMGTEIQPVSNTGAPENTSGTTTAAAAATSVKENPDDPFADHEPGIYIYYKTSNGEHQLTQLEPSVYTQNKMGGTFASAMTYGIAKMHWKAVVNSSHAVVNTSDHDPVFYFYFEKKGAGLSYSSFASSTPNEFTLLRFDIKKGVRETTVMKASAWGMESGSQENAVVSFTYTKIRSGVYKVIPKASLHSGEYCFFSSQGGAFFPGAASSNRVFDFGIKSNQ